MSELEYGRALDRSDPPRLAVDSRKLRVKRLFDFVLALTLLVFLAPLLVVIAISVLLDSNGPVFFLQERTGLRQQKFLIYKFRTMKAGNGDGAKAPPAASAGGADVAQTVRGDARVTRVGVLLRRLSWDELPQLWNVVKGDMSLVGPRPHALAHDCAWSRTVPHYDDRFRVRPGLTGFAQVRGLRGEVCAASDIAERVRADNAYIESWSLWLDLRILLMTFPLLFWDPHAY
jgi:putative colanic acid biosynthesis UDP-glucose lipid carrier transferase